MVNTRFVGSGRVKEGGFLATHKQDFNAHVEGGDWRHGTTHIDLESEFSPKSVFQSTVVDAGGIGDDSELSGNSLEDVLVSIDEVLKRRRSFTATIAAAGSGIRSADLESDSLDTLWSMLNDQVATQRGGVFFVHTREDSANTSYTLESVSSSYYPYMIAEQRDFDVSVDSGIESRGTPVQPTTTSSEITGIWDGFRFHRSGTNRFVVQPGFQAHNCTFYDPILDWNGNSDSAPYIFKNCGFSKETSTSGLMHQISATDSNPINAVFENCVWNGSASGTTTNFLIFGLNFSSDYRSTENKIIFKNCIFDASSGKSAMEISNCNQTVIFDNCEFIGNPSGTGSLSNALLYIHQCHDVRFFGCKFRGTPVALYVWDTGGIMEDCTLELDTDINVNTDQVFVLTGSETDTDNPFIIKNLKVFFDGTFGDLQTGTASAIDLNVANSVIDGLHIVYRNSTQQHPRTLRIRFNGELKTTGVRNVTIDVNQKAFLDTASSPTVVIVTGPTDNNNRQGIYGLKIMNLGRGNDSGTAPLGTVVELPPNSVFLQDALIEGPGLALADTLNHAWSRIINSGIGLYNCHFPNPAATSQGIVAEQSYIRINSSFFEMKDCIFRQFPSLHPAGMFSNGFVDVEASRINISSNEFIMDPQNGHDIIRGVPTSEDLFITNNRFISFNASATRTGRPIYVEGDRCTITNNYIEHRPDAAVIAIRAPGDFNIITSNYIKRLSSIYTVDMISTGTSIVRHNIGHMPIISTAVIDSPAAGDLTINGQDFNGIKTGAITFVEIWGSGAGGDVSAPGIVLDESIIIGTAPGAVGNTQIIIDSTLLPGLASGDFVRVNSVFETSNVVAIS